jgi:hypothetical protein
MSGMERAVDRVQPQREHLRAAQVALADVCAADPPRRDDIVAALGALRVAFVEHVEYAEGDGQLFDELLDDSPTEAAPEIDRLRRDHLLIGSTLDRADELLAGDVDPADERVTEVTAELVRLVAQHRRRGAELLYNVYDVDTGAGD